MNNYLNLKELFSLGYEISAVNTSFRYVNVILFLILAVLLISICLFFMSWERIGYIKPNRVVFLGFAWFLFVSDIYGALTLISRVEGLPFFSMRLMMVIWFIVLAIGLVWLLVYMIFVYPKKIRKFRERKNKSKYLHKGAKI